GSCRWGRRRGRSATAPGSPNRTLHPGAAAGRLSPIRRSPRRGGGRALAPDGREVTGGRGEMARKKRKVGAGGKPPSKEPANYDGWLKRARTIVTDCELCDPSLLRR